MPCHGWPIGLPIAPQDWHWMAIGIGIRGLAFVDWIGMEIRGLGLELGFGIRLQFVPCRFALIKYCHVHSFPFC